MNPEQILSFEEYSSEELELQNKTYKAVLEDYKNISIEYEKENEDLKKYNSALQERLEIETKNKEHIEEIYKGIVRENEKLKEDIKGLTNVLKVLGALIN